MSQDFEGAGKGSGFRGVILRSLEGFKRNSICATQKPFCLLDSESGSQESGQMNKDGSLLQSSS